MAVWSDRLVMLSLAICTSSIEATLQIKLKSKPLLGKVSILLSSTSLKDCCKASLIGNRLDKSEATALQYFATPVVINDT